jgi:hypothetical protein
MSDVSPLLFNIFLAAVTVLVIVAIIVFIRLLKIGIERGAGTKTRVALKPAGEPGKWEIAKEESIMGGTEAAKASRPTEQAVDELTYEHSGVYKWFNAQLQKLKKERKEEK